MSGGYAQASKDHADDKRITLLTFVVVLGIFALSISTQSVFVLGILPDSMLEGAAPPANPALNLAMRLGANVAGVAVGTLGVAILIPQRRGLRGRLWSGLVIVLVCAIVRAALQVAIGIYRPDDVTEITVEVVSTSVLAAVSLIIALAQTDARRRLRQEERASAARSLQAARALEALQGAELRVRREVADGLHGTVQQRFILLATRLGTVADALDGEAQSGAAAELRAIRDELDAVREQDLRDIGELLYPARMDGGAVTAIRTLFRRLPAEIAVQLTFTPQATAIDETPWPREGALTPERRLLLVRVAEEGLSNALKHGSATDVRLSLEVGRSRDDREALVLTIDDNGSGFSGVIQWGGLRRFHDQLDVLGGSLSLLAGPAGGSRLVAVVPTG